MPFENIIGRKVSSESFIEKPLEEGQSLRYHKLFGYRVVSKVKNSNKATHFFSLLLYGRNESDAAKNAWEKLDKKVSKYNLPSNQKQVAKVNFVLSKWADFSLDKTKIDDDLQNLVTEAKKEGLNEETIVALTKLSNSLPTGNKIHASIQEILKLNGKEDQLEQRVQAQDKVITKLESKIQQLETKIENLNLNIQTIISEQPKKQIENTQINKEEVILKEKQKLLIEDIEKLEKQIQEAQSRLARINIADLESKQTNLETKLKRIEKALDSGQNINPNLGDFLPNCSEALKIEALTRFTMLNQLPATIYYQIRDECYDKFLSLDPKYYEVDSKSSLEPLIRNAYFRKIKVLGALVEVIQKLKPDILKVIKSSELSSQVKEDAVKQLDEYLSKMRESKTTYSHLF